MRRLVLPWSSIGWFAAGRRTLRLMGQGRGLVGPAFVLGYLIATYGTVHGVLPRYLSAELNLYIAQPLMWGGLAMLSYALWRGLPDRPELSRWLVGLAVLAGLFQVSILLIAGMLYGFGHSPYAREAFSVVKNGFYLGTLLLGLELSRSYLLHAWGLSRRLGVPFVALLFAALAVPVGQLSLLGQTGSVLELTGASLLPAGSESLLATFLAALGGPGPALVYRAVLATFEWFSPILPALEWGVKALVGTMGPIMAMLIVRGMYFRSAAHSKEGKEENGVSSLRLTAAGFLVALIWLNAGLLGIRPAVVTGVSMEPSLRMGDIAFTREVPPETLQLGEVIRYRSGNTVIMHRIIEIAPGTGGPIFVTRGGNNDAADRPVPGKRIEGRVVFSRPKLGWIRIYLHELVDLVTHDRTAFPAESK
jgi:signal peptidase I